MLKLVDITKEYKTEEESVFALRGVSVEFRKSEFVSILGPSGCGKTTLLNIVGGLDRYTSGDIQVDGVSTTRYRDEDWDTYRNRRIGFVFQSYNLIPHMNVLKNVQLSLTLAGISKEEGRERAMEALRKVGLEKQAKKKPNQMSGGQMQRVAIARALVNDPDIILADEPTGALDSESGLQVMELLKEVARDRLVVMVTHNGQLAEEYSTRIINLKDGEIVGDTMPYDSEAEAAAEDLARISDAVDETALPAPESAEESGVAENVFTEDGVEIAGTDASTAVLSENGQEGETSSSPADPAKKRNIFKRIGDRIRAFRKREKSYMSIATAVNLSWTNLLSKKGRTLLTSIAGSIGIIGIVQRRGRIHRGARGERPLAISHHHQRAGYEPQRAHGKGHGRDEHQSGISRHRGDRRGQHAWQPHQQQGRHLRHERSEEHTQLHRDEQVSVGWRRRR